MSNASSAAKNVPSLVQGAIFCAIAALGWLIPPIGALTSEGIKILAVLFAVVYGWSVTSHVWPSLLAFILIPFTGLVDLKGLIIAGWGSDVFLFMVLIFILIAYLEESGTSAFVAAWLLTRKFLFGHPWRLLSMLFAVAWLLCTFVNIFAGIFITWGIIYKMCDILGYKPHDKFPTLVIFGVAAMGALSLSAVPWAHNALVILGSFTETTGTPINMLHYLTYSLSFVIFAIAAFLLLCRWVFRLDVSQLKNLKLDFFNPSDLEFTQARKIALCGVGGLVILLLLPSILPASWGFTAALTQLGLSNKLILVFLVLSFIRIEDKPAFDFISLANKGMQWGTLIMTMCILAFVNLLGSPATGISAFLNQILAPLFANSSYIWFFLILVAITVILTNLTINMVVAIVMMTAAFPVAANLGIMPEQIVYLLTICCTIAFILPSASPAAMVLFANNTWMKATDVYKYALPTIIVFSLIALLLNILLFSF